MKCYVHPDREAVAADIFVDLAESTQFNVAYKRVPICESCRFYRSNVNTSRVEPLAEATNAMKLEVVL